MTIDKMEERVVTTAATTPAGQTVQRASSLTSTSGPSGQEMTRRVVILLFGLIQVVIALRFVLLLLNAREANGLVSGILSFSELFVAPFEGILRTDALTSSGSILDITAIVAFVGWTILELIVLWIAGVFRREPA